VDYYTILAQRNLTARDFVGERVEIIRLFDTYQLYLGFDGETGLKLSSIPEMPYLHTVEKRYIPVRKARDWFPKKIGGSVLESVEILHGDRVLTFVFSSGYRLVFEMTGRHANIVCVDGEGIVAGAVRKVTARQSGVRTVKSGARYAPPPPRDFPDVLWAPLGSLARRLKESEETIVNVLAKTICSGSRLCAREAAARSGVEPGRAPADLNDDEIFRLLKSTAEIAAAAEKGGEGGTVVYGDDGLPRDVFPMRMVSAAPGDTYCGNLNEAVTRYSLERGQGLERARLKRNLLSALSAEERNLLRTLERVERDRKKQAESEKLERIANTIMANLHLIRRGMTSVSLPDPYGAEEETIVELDPSLPPSANAERYFARARKLKSAARRSEEKSSEIKRRLAEIDREREHLESLEELKELRAAASSYPKKSAGARTPDEDRPFPRRFTSVSGLEIVVGRNDKENDELLRWARKNDLWLHAQGVGGSHVILRRPGNKQEPDHRSIEQAAAIAAYYSKAKTSAVVPVVCTRVKYVVKRRGQPPGQVTYTREKVIFTEPGIPAAGE